MARVSFALRRTAAELGSYLRYDSALSYRSSGATGASVSPGARVDYDSALHADSILTPPTTFPTSFFEAVSVCYGEVDLSWGVTLIDKTQTALTTIPQATQVLIVYSPYGEPQTIQSGDIIVQSTFDTTHTLTGLPEGRFAYFSMFIHFETSDTPGYYERVATLSLIIPKDYGSTLALWQRIPQYYRNQDTAIGTQQIIDGTYFASPCLGTLPIGEVVGPLFKYLAIIGFDIDKIRTTLDYLMTSKDPSLANTETLDALSDQMGGLIQASDLGGQRLRALLNDIGFFGRAKGTFSGTEFFTRTLTNGDMTIVGDVVNIYSQRVNYITVPKDGTGITTHRAANITEVNTPQAFTFDTSTHSGSYTVSGSTFTTTGASAGWTDVMLHLNSPVSVQLGDTVVFTVQGNVLPNIKWVRLVDTIGRVVGTQSVSNPLTRSFEVKATANASVGIFMDTSIEYLADLSIAPLSNTLLLAERNHSGAYFDGDTVTGGWLIDATSISDYRWDGSANASVSLYAEDYKRTQGVIADLLPDVLPITKSTVYTVASYHAHQTATSATWDASVWDGPLQWG
jgi:hypothetical protein